jgi:hypothetical protein
VIVVVGDGDRVSTECLLERARLFDGCIDFRRDRLRHDAGYGSVSDAIEIFTPHHAYKQPAFSHG